jgi:3-oxoacid CoA-transferase
LYTQRAAADFAFLLHGFHYLMPEGVMAIILPHGVLFRSGAEQRIRTKLLKDGHIDTVILGAYEVDQTGSVANWSTADAKRGGIGGAMDLLSGCGNLIIVLEHTDSKGRPKLRRACTYPLTGKACVTWVVTDLALLHWEGGRFVLKEVAPGFTAREVMDLTEMELVAAPEVGSMGRA